ncbi:histone H2B type 1-A-like [Neofelis nebulosa]|uniref:histone H2B type 1-A-like n=1 Tax=Neofelis nebulosa TaxID=61452 RepID=UPI00272D5A03|nr:histone H2B type 1-A-like [Neofelis nebulosa]
MATGPKTGKLTLRMTHFATYFPRILKQSQEGLALLQEAMSVMVSLLTDILERIVGVASRLAHSTKHSTITSKEIQRAMRLLLLREFGKQVVSEATKAVIRYTR